MLNRSRVNDRIIRWRKYSLCGCVPLVSLLMTAAVAALLLPLTLLAAEINASPDGSLPQRSTQRSAGSESDDAVTDPTRSSFGAGRWLLSAYSSAAVGKASHQVYAGHLGLGYYFMDRVSLNLEAVGYSIDHARNSRGGGLDLLPRWHYLEWDKWSLYLDGGPGIVYTNHTLRDPGTHFNFTLQAGIGATYAFTERFGAMAGSRWFHISNARIRGRNRNVGFDSPIFYLGMMSVF